MAFELQIFCGTSLMWLEISYPPLRVIAITIENKITYRATVDRNQGLRRSGK